MRLRQLSLAVILTFLFHHAPVDTRKMHLSTNVVSTLCNHRKKFQETSTLQPPAKRLSPDITVPCGWFDFCTQQGDQCETEYKSCDEAGGPTRRPIAKDQPTVGDTTVPPDGSKPTGTGPFPTGPTTVPPENTPPPIGETTASAGDGTTAPPAEETTAAPKGRSVKKGKSFKGKSIKAKKGKSAADPAQATTLPVTTPITTIPEGTKTASTAKEETTTAASTQQQTTPPITTQGETTAAPPEETTGPTTSPPEKTSPSIAETTASPEGETTMTPPETKQEGTTTPPPSDEGTGTAGTGPFPTGPTTEPPEKTPPPIEGTTEPSAESKQEGTTTPPPPDEGTGTGGPVPTGESIVTRPEGTVTPTPGPDSTAASSLEGDEDCDPTTPATKDGQSTTEDDCPCRKRKKTTVAPIPPPPEGGNARPNPPPGEGDEPVAPPAEANPDSPAAPSAKGESYTAKVYKIKVVDDAGYQALLKLEAENINLDFWSKPSLEYSTSVKVPDLEEPKVLPIFKQYKMNFTVTLFDLKKAMKDDATQRDKHRARMAKMRGRGIKNGEITFEEFSKQEEIYKWVDKVAADNSEVITVSSIGTTSEGRDIKMLKFAKGGETRPSVWIDCGIHAREWLAIATGTYLINELKKLAASSEESILDKINIYFVPIVNVDGYAFSWTPEKRYWRKNRRQAVEGQKCLGVDLNRNFGVEFGGDGSSDNPCSETYRGPEAFSEAESQAIRDVIMGEKKNGVKWLAYVTIHTFAQVLLTQWGYAQEVPEDYDELKKVGQIAADAIKEVHGKDYKVGGAANLLGSGAGGSDDWAKADESRGGAGIKYSYTFELRPNKEDEGNFVIDPKFIKPTGEEIWIGMQAFFKYWIEEEASAGGNMPAKALRSATKKQKTFRSTNKHKPPKKYQSEKKYKYTKKYKKL